MKKVSLKLILLLIFTTTCCFSQTEEKDNSILGYVNFGINHNVGIGDNIISKNFDGRTGFNVGFGMNVYKKIIAGVDYSLFYNTIKDKSLVGQYSRSNVSFFQFQVGYYLSLSNNLKLIPRFGIGPIEYNNQKANIKFNDTGTGIAILPEINYIISDNFAIYLAPTYRRDFMQTEAPEEVRDFFRKVNYFQFRFGINLFF